MSCSVVPAAVSLRRSGASSGATLSFLISTPETGVDSIAISYVLLDPIMTVFRPLAAFIAAVFAGILNNMFGVKEKDESYLSVPKCNFCDDKKSLHTHTIKEKFNYSMRYAFRDLLGDISGWLIIGIVIAGFISYIVPFKIIEGYLGSGLRAMLIMLVVGISLYICATGSTSIATALIAKGVSPDVALVFLLAGPATNVANIITAGKLLGRKSLFIYLFSLSFCAIGLGIFLNYSYSGFGIDVRTTLGRTAEFLPPLIKFVSAIVLIVLVFINIWCKIKKKGC